MSFLDHMSPATRRSALALMMLAVLLACTAIAWVIVAARSPVRDGETWYLITAGETPIGWRVIQSGPLEAGGRSGYDIMFAGDGDASILWSMWRLNATNSRGRYASEAARMRDRRISTTGTTYIMYDAPALNLRHELVGAVPFSGQETVGDTYIPEGRLIPTIAEVARTGQPFVGEMVVDRLMTLRPLTVSPDGGESRVIDGETVELTAVKLMWTGEQTMMAATRYLVAADGGIAAIERTNDEGVVTESFTRTSLEKVRRQFPTAHRWRSNLLRDKTLD